MTTAEVLRVALWPIAIFAFGWAMMVPVVTLLVLDLHPDRRGMATGMANMGFGGGAIIGAPLKRYFMRLFYEPPEYLGAIDQVYILLSFVAIAWAFGWRTFAIAAKGRVRHGSGHYRCYQ